MIEGWDAVERRAMSRAHGRCECMGQCGFNHRFQPRRADGKVLPVAQCRVPHALPILRKRDYPCSWVLARGVGPGKVAFRHLYRDKAVEGEKALLVVAPLDGDRENREPGNILALCQRCALLIRRAA